MNIIKKIHKPSQVSTIQVVWLGHGVYDKRGVRQLASLSRLHSAVNII